ncbi:unnamed protein product [Hyaloperonospora brassicae]|uniref:Cytochrome b5 heme-binding domain-containing protein n=1 Tax=Hyaloperonospora brassicae TaxID=162125 RepID=A0AAV0TQC7_HYABA|nr:unnamed protein product [Hyaloperonospora brassicae]
MAEASNATPKATAAAREFSLDDVAPHNSADDCWMVLRQGGIRRVYDVTRFLDDHPGGPEIMVDVAGRDATDEFEDIGHSNDARAQLQQFAIGQIEGDVAHEAAPATARKSGGQPVTASGRQDISGQNGPLFAVLVAAAAVAVVYYKYW